MLTRGSAWRREVSSLVDLLTLVAGEHHTEKERTAARPRFVVLQRVLVSLKMIATVTPRPDASLAHVV